MIVTNRDGEVRVIRRGRDRAPNKGGRLAAGQNTVPVRMARERGLNTTDMCAAMGCSARSYYNYATLRLAVPVVFLFGLCDLLDADADELIDEEGYFRIDGDDAT